MSEEVLVELCDGVIEVTINRPDACEGAMSFAEKRKLVWRVNNKGCSYA